jgi:hypothetical protein
MAQTLESKNHDIDLKSILNLSPLTLVPLVFFNKNLRRIKGYL